MRIVVTGAGGFIGSFLVEALAQRGDNVEAWSRGTVDITDQGAVDAALARAQPDAVVHLAAQSLPGLSWIDPGETYRINVGGSIAVLEGARKLSKPPRVLLAGSSAEYAEPADGSALDENAPIVPNSPYASSKSAVAQFARLYRDRYALPVVIFRPFAFIGPRKTGDASSDFARRIVAIERGSREPMVVGDTSVVRDMIDVRDGADGIVRLIDAGISGETYNISGGRGVSIDEMLQSYRRLATVPVEIVRDPGLLRPLEQKVKIGKASKLRELGWHPSRQLEDTLADTLAYWRAQER